MALYDIETEQGLGISHCGSVSAEGVGIVELSDEDVQTLVQLIREKGTTDVEELGIEETHPEIYEKLRKAYHDMAYETERSYWMWEGFENDAFEYDIEDLMEYCREHLGFDYEPEDQDGENDDDDFDEEAEYEAFEEWLSDYVHGLSEAEAFQFIEEHMNGSVDLDDLEYVVEIPQSIIDIANNEM